MRYAYLFTALLCVSLCAGCGQRDAVTPPSAFGTPLDLRYAEQFTMERDDAGRVLVTIAGAERFLLVWIRSLIIGRRPLVFRPVNRWAVITEPISERYRKEGFIEHDKNLKQCA